MQPTFCFHIKALKNNYIWILGEGRKILIIDPGEAKPVIDIINIHNYEISGILLTHHHADHIGGVKELQHHFKKKIKVYGPKRNLEKIIDQAVIENDRIPIGMNFVTVLETPGHTLDHVCYYQNQSRYSPPRLFCGDTLFSCGCGRLFEGTAAQMIRSLKKICSLPNKTLIYCAHEYTLENIRFAEYVDHQNQTLIEYKYKTEKKLLRGEPSIPSLLGMEKMINPFLKINQFIENKKVTNKILNIMNEEECFKSLREAKDNFGR